MSRLPAWYKGRKRECFRCGYWYGELDYRIHKNAQGQWECNKCKDSLTDSEREEQIRR